MKHYQFKNQPDGYCMSKEEWISLWEKDEECCGRIFDESLPGETPYWIGPSTQSNKPSGYIKGQYRDSTPQERAGMAQGQWDIMTRGYDNDPHESSFNEIIHTDICTGRKP